MIARADRRGERYALTIDDAISSGIDSFSEAFRSDEPATMMNAFLTRNRK